MLISRLSESETQEGWREGREDPISEEHTEEYQTANELFEMMVKGHPFTGNPTDSLSEGDLVLLYQNIEVGTKLMSDAGELRPRKPNQFIESVVYNDGSEGSDYSDTYSEHDWKDVVSVNKEQINLLSDPPSHQNTLSHKFGDLGIQNTHLTTQYDKHFLFKDPYIKDQLKNFNAINVDGTDFKNSLFPASLLDYISCKRLKDNYNFYMENVIRYVTHTIEQLKRISNGDYLTERAKEKWREVENDAKNNLESRMVLATSSSIPLQIEQKINGPNTWDEVIHSEIDIRTLTKVLEKKIIVQVPKIITEPLKLFSKLYTNNLIVSCARQANEQAGDAPKQFRMNVVLQLNRSESDQKISTISSILILKTDPAIQQGTTPAKTSLLALPDIEHSQVDHNKKSVEIIDIQDDNTDLEEKNCDSAKISIKDDTLLTIDDDYIDKESTSSSYFGFGDSRIVVKNFLAASSDANILHKESPFDGVSQSEFSLPKHEISMSCVPEENSEEFPIIKKKSHAKVRVKSPYENKSYILDEKKRKRLLEIRERREKRKAAMGDNSKIKKYKYGKGPLMPQPSNSVTKLSITNKSFYNSIYGQSTNNFDKALKLKTLKGTNDTVINIPMEHLEDERGDSMSTPEKNDVKYVNRSYYLDDTVTEVMYTSQSDYSSDLKDIFSASTSLVSTNDVDVKVSTKIDSTANTCTKITSLCEQNYKFIGPDEFDDIGIEDNKMKASSQSKLENPTTLKELNKEDSKQSTLDCRKSIDKLYELMRKIGKDEFKMDESKYTDIECKNESHVAHDTSIIPCSDSGTSLKHQLSSSHPSSYSFDKMKTTDDSDLKDTVFQKPDSITNSIPKVIISTKERFEKLEPNKSKKERKKVTLVSPVKGPDNPLKLPDNPLKAISQLLRDFENVKKSKLKTSIESKPHKKLEVSFDSSMAKPGSLRRRSRLDHVMKDDLQNDKDFIPLCKERKHKPLLMDATKAHASNDNHVDRIAKKKIADIIDEVKEAKGEAVRGPSKFNSRLNSLAQPKKCYVQAHSEEYQNKYGRNLMADRLQRLASSVPSPNHDKPSSAVMKGRQRRNSADSTKSATARRSPNLPPPIEKGLKNRRSPGSSPTAPATMHRQRPNDPETLKYKMVESYVENHYGRLSPLPTDKEAPHGALQARVPLVPHDLDLASMPSSPTGEESTAIGSKLKYIIDNIVNSKPILAALTESRESDSKQSDHNIDIDFKLSDNNQFRDDNVSSADTDFCADIHEDKNVKTAVEVISRDHKRADDSLSDLRSARYNDDCADNTGQSSAELETLEDALHRLISVGSFYKRLRIKNVTLTPKHSTQQMIILHSSVADSLLNKSIKSDNSKHSISMRSLPTVIKPRYDTWKLSNIPMQITTVGYAFPTYTATPLDFKRIQSLQEFIQNSTTVIRENNIDCITNLDPEASPCKSNKIPDPQNEDIIFKNIITVEKETHQPVIPCKLSENMECENNNNEDKTVNQAECHLEPDNGIPKNIPTAIGKSVESIGLEIMKKDLDEMNCTSSLDVLVDLLNEIQKITACHISNTKNCTENNKCEHKDVIVNENPRYAVENKYSHELVSIASLDKLRQLESSNSIYSLYISNDESETGDGIEIKYPKLYRNFTFNKNNIDKEVTVDIIAKELVSTFTEVPSKFFPVTITHSTNITNSLVGILSKPSSTTSSLVEYESIYSNSSNSPQEDIVDLYQKTCNIQNPLRMSRKVSGITHKFNIRHKRLTNGDVIKGLDSKVQGNKSKYLQLNHYKDFDPVIKMKRDILVTLYSMLVLTVFAALSFPEMYYIE